MKVTIVGGGPGGLYLAVLLKAADATRTVTVVERNRADETFGFGATQGTEYNHLRIPALAKVALVASCSARSSLSHW